DQKVCGGTHAIRGWGLAHALHGLVRGSALPAAGERGDEPSHGLAELLRFERLGEERVAALVGGRVTVAEEEDAASGALGSTCKARAELRAAYVAKLQLCRHE